MGPKGPMGPWSAQGSWAPYVPQWAPMGPRSPIGPYDALWARGGHGATWPMDRVEPIEPMPAAGGRMADGRRLAAGPTGQARSG